MKVKRIISALLVFTALVTLLTACGKKEETAKKSSINPELVSAFGEEMIEGEEETISKLVDGLKNCYESYQKSKDIDAFVKDVDSAMTSYKGYLKEISAELQGMYENEPDKNKKMELMTLYSSSIAYLADESSWSTYKMCLDNNMEPWQSKDEVEQAVINYINDISEFFYCKKITG